MTLLGVYGANDPSEIREFEDWLGRPVDAVHAVVGNANWWDFTESASWMANDLWSGMDQPILWSVPLLVYDGAPTLAQAAQGQFDYDYSLVARSLLQSRADDGGPIYVRTGWEFNIDAFPWSAAGHEADYVGAYRAFVDSFRGVSDRFRFEWNLNVSWGGLDPAKAYPGDHYVDVVGMDFYWSPYYQGWDPDQAWNLMLTAPYGLQWLESFAAAHGKPTAYSEWGIQSDNAGTYIERAKAWFDSHDVVYQSYWNSSADGTGKLSDGQLPNSGWAFREAFGDETPQAGGSVPPQAEGPSWIVAQHAWDTLSGTDGADHFKALGNNLMEGGAGNDIYEVSSRADRVVEGANGGTDTVRTWIDGYVLPGNVENLVLTGTGWISGTGNGLGNAVIGNDAPNTLDGRGGDDVLTGGAGHDTFVIGKGLGHDTITDFHPHAWGGDADTLLLQGFGWGAVMWNTGELFSVRSADGVVTQFTLAGVSALTSGDYLFG